MSLDKYRRTPAAPDESAPALGNPGEVLRQQTNRYHTFVTIDQSETDNVPEPTQAIAVSVEPGTNSEHPPSPKGNRLKSKKRAVPRPKASARNQPASGSGVKIVFIDETMRDEYIQLAGYLMVKHRIRLTMTAYFCFLHEQAITQQGDDAFLNDLAQFAQPRT